MKRFALIGGGLIAALLIAVAVVPYLIPSEVYKAQVEKQAENALGRDVTLSGDARLSIVPRIAAKIGGVTIANPDGFSQENMIEAGELRARVKFWPLISGRVEVAEISLVDANVSLERLASGESNWIFSSDTPKPDTPSSGSGNVNAGIDSARLLNSSLTYADAVTGERYALSEVSARASMTALDEPFSLNGEGKFNEMPFDISLDLDTIAALSNGDTAKVDVSLDTDFGSVSYDGALTLAEILRLDGAFSANSQSLGEIQNVLGVGSGINLAALGNISAEGRISGKIDALRLDFEKVSQKADAFSSSYSGLMDLGSSSPLDGAFTFKSGDAGKAMSSLGLDYSAQLAPVGAVDAAGTVKGSFAQPKLTFERLKQNSDLMSNDYNGILNIGDVIGLDGRLVSNISDAGRVLTQFGMDGGPVEILEKLEFNGALKGPVSSLSISGAKMDHESRLLNLSFNGDASLGPNGKIAGPIEASSENFRTLLETLGVELAPGDTLETFNLNGVLSGSPNNLQIAALQLALDDMKGTGSAGIDLSRKEPKITADLTLPSLDLSPFLGDGKSSTTSPSAPTGWSKTALALEGLRAVNLDLKLKSDLLNLGKVELKETDLTASLDNGNFKADIAKMIAFGGDWRGKFNLDASNATPKLTIDLLGQNVAMQSVLSTFTNLKTVSGTGGLTFTATSTGESIDALVRGLNGELKTDLGDGAIKGFNVAQIVRSLNSIPSALADGSLRFALSPQAETDFTQLTSALTIRNGVANVDILRVLNPAVLLDGKGRIDLANQSIDLSITPSVDTAGIGERDMLKLNGEPFALPFRVSGNWLAPSVSIDNAAITQQLQLRATGQIRDRIRDELGSDLKDVLGDAIGGNKQPAPANDNTPAPEDINTAPVEPEDTGEKETTPPDPKDEIEDAVENLANDALKDLFGRKKKD